MNKAIILLAGESRRLWPKTKAFHKSLLIINQRALLWYSITNLISVGVEEFILVIGHQGNLIRTFIKEEFPQLKVIFIENNQYQKFNNVYSFYLGLKSLNDCNFFRLEGDLIYTKTILQKLIKSPHQINVAVHKKKKIEPDEFCIQYDANAKSITNFSKNIPIEKSYGEAKGIEFVRSESLLLIKKSFEELIQTSDMQGFSEQAYLLAHTQWNIPLSIVNLSKNDAWMEVDTEEDLKSLNEFALNCKAKDSKASQLCRDLNE